MSSSDKSVRYFSLSVQYLDIKYFFTNSFRSNKDSFTLYWVISKSSVISSYAADVCFSWISFTLFFKVGSSFCSIASTLSGVYKMRVVLARSYVAGVISISWKKALFFFWIATISCFNWSTFSVVIFSSKIYGFMAISWAENVSVGVSRFRRNFDW